MIESMDERNIKTWSTIGSRATFGLMIDLDLAQNRKFDDTYL